MNESTQTTLLVATIIAGLSGWGGIMAWWLRERSKTVRAIRHLRRTNTKLQKTVMFTIDRWQDQVLNSHRFLLLEREYADQLGAASGVPASEVKKTVRDALESDLHRQSTTGGSQAFVPETQKLLANIAEVRHHVITGEKTIAELAIEESFRSAA